MPALAKSSAHPTGQARSASRATLVVEGAQEPTALAIAEASAIVNIGGFLGTSASTPKGRAKVLNFLKHATAITMEDGFSEVTFREVARRAGVGIRHVQYYFHSLDALIEAVLIYTVAIYFSVAERDEPAEATPEKAFETKLRNVLIDCTQSETSHYFLRLWSISLENSRFANIMDLVYANVALSWGSDLQKINTNLSSEECFILFSIIMSQIDGFKVRFCRPRSDALDSSEFIELTVASLMKIIDAFGSPSPAKLAGER